MLTLLDLSPLLAVVVLLATRRVGVLAASWVSLALAVAAVAANLIQHGEGRSVLPFLIAHTLRGSWLAWQAVVLMIGGFFFFECLRVGGSQFSAAIVPSYRRLFLVCLFLGPFFEASTGFGVGLLLTMSFLRSMGLRGPPAVMLGLFSQAMAPWGALGLGMVIGAHIAEVTVGSLAVGSAILLVPLLLVDLLVFWRTAGRMGFAPTRRERLEDVGWLIAAATGLLAANVFLPFELAVIAPFGVLIVLLLYRVDALRRWRESLPATGPYIAVSLLLIITRLLPGVPDHLRVWRLAPFPEGVGYEPFYNPSFWLFGVGLAVLLRVSVATADGDAGFSRRLAGVLRAMARGLWRPGLVTVLFLVVAQLLAASGVARVLAEQWYGVAGTFAIVTGPVLPGLIGFLSASNTASNSMLMPVQAALAASAGVSLPWQAALQNVSGGQFCSLSPVRITMGCALLADGTRENAVYTEGWPLLVGSAGLLLLEGGLILLS